MTVAEGEMSVVWTSAAAMSMFSVNDAVDDDDEGNRSDTSTWGTTRPSAMLKKLPCINICECV